MEYCVFGDLSIFIKKRDQIAKHPSTRDIMRRYPNPGVGGLHEVLTRHFLQQLASALRFLRDKDLIHRDVKPQNLLLLPSPLSIAQGSHRVLPCKATEDSFTPQAGVASLPMLKIADFGFARSLPSTSLADTLCGSPLYMAPEILKYQSYGAEADLWSVGTVLFEMVSARPPFRAANHVELLRKIEKAADKVKFPEYAEVSDEIRTLVKRLLKINPAERMTFDEFFGSPVIRSEIPGLVPEDREHMVIPGRPKQEPVREPVVEDIPSPPKVHPRPTAVGRVGSKDADLQRATPGWHLSESTLPDRKGRTPRPSQETRDRPSVGQARDRVMDDDARRRARENADRDMAFEREYIIVEKRAVEVNAFADELGNQQTQAGPMVRRNTAEPGSTPQSAPSRALEIMTGRAHRRQNSFDRVYGGSPTSGSAKSAISKALYLASGRLFGVSLSPPSLGIAKGGRSPPMGYSPFPAYPLATNLLLEEQSAAGKTGDGELVDEDMQTLHIIEECATRSDVIYGFAEVKLKQLMPLAPSQSPHDAGGVIHPPNMDPDEEGEDGNGSDGLTVDAVVLLSEEALVLYVKGLALLAKSMDIAGAWWARKNGTDMSMVVAAPSMGPNAAYVSKQMNNVVQWVRSRFNEVLEKAEYCRERLVQAQKQLPQDHPYHRSHQQLYQGNSGGNHSSGNPGNIAANGGHNHPHAPDPTSAIDLDLAVVVCTGITAEKLMYDRALEMSRTAAINELTGQDLPGCEIAYVTAIRMLEAVLDGEEVRGVEDAKGLRLDPKRESRAIAGLQDEDRRVVEKRECSSWFPCFPTGVLVHDMLMRITVVASIRNRLTALRQKLNILSKRAATVNVNARPVSPGTTTAATTVGGSPSSR